MSELRKNPITEGWVIISTERGERPSDLPPVATRKPSKLCPFCVGKEATTPPEIFSVRDTGSAADGPGWQVRVVPNKFPALRVEGTLEREGVGMFDKMSGIGAHEVVIENPSHEKRFWDYSVAEIGNVIEAYVQRTTDLKRDSRLRHVLIFKNEGEQAGASLEHSHSQLIATPVVPKRVREELAGASNYFNYKERCVFCDQIREEQRFGVRMIYENDYFVAFCPFASRFPFEITILPTVHRPDLTTTEPEERMALAETLRLVTRKLNEALNGPQYNWIVHIAPTRPSPRASQDMAEDFHWHIEVIPRLTRIAGFEWGSGFYINPTAPEHAAEYLREVEGRGSAEQEST